MPGKGAIERRKQKKLEQVRAIRAAEREYLSNGGEKVCRTCLLFNRCPVFGDEKFECWIFNFYPVSKLFPDNKNAENNQAK